MSADLKSSPDHFCIPSDFDRNAPIDTVDYAAKYRSSIECPKSFWGEHCRIDWIRRYTKVKGTNFTPRDDSIRWFEEGTLNVCAKCVDRHLEKRGEQTAISFEPNDPHQPDRHITCRELHFQVCRLAYVIEVLGIHKGDGVVIYLQMLSKAQGARVDTCDAKMVITANFVARDERNSPLTSHTDAALLHLIHDPKVIIVRRTDEKNTWVEDRDFDYSKTLLEDPDYNAPVETGADDPHFILYAIGSTRQPWGVVNSSRSYRVYAAVSLEAEGAAMGTRVLGRYSCETCGECYHDSFRKPAVGGICDTCVGTAFRRSRDDNAETVRAAGRLPRTDRAARFLIPRERPTARCRRHGRRTRIHRRTGESLTDKPGHKTPGRSSRGQRCPKEGRFARRVRSGEQQSSGGPHVGNT